ncbi:hypothetical protein Aperf_G00000076365 [Anoplocephala perfoliata]
MQFLIRQIVSNLNTFRQGVEPLNGDNQISTNPADVRVLLCDDAADLQRIVNAVSDAVNDDAFILSRIIVAIEDPQIVGWDEAIYEEYLIERVKRRTDDFVIGLAIDLWPTMRRVRRIRQLLGKDCMLIIPNEGKGWRTAYPELLGSFVVIGGRFLTTVDCVPGVSEAIRDSELFSPLEKWISPQPRIIDLRESIHKSGPRGM